MTASSRSAHAALRTTARSVRRERTRELVTRIAASLARASTKLRRAPQTDARCAHPTCARERPARAARPAFDRRVRQTRAARRANAANARCERRGSDSQAACLARRGPHATRAQREADRQVHVARPRGASYFRATGPAQSTKVLGKMPSSTTAMAVSSRPARIVGAVGRRERAHRIAEVHRRDDAQVVVDADRRC